MSNFENIKVGDTVLTYERVRVGWNASRYFLTPKKVTRLTKTQFVTEDGRKFSKNDGYEVGGDYSEPAYREGELVNRWTGEVAKDQTNEMKAFVAEQKQRKELKDMAYNVNRDIHEVKAADLDRVETHLYAITNILNNEQSK